MIENKKMLYIGLFLLFLSLVLIFPFPHNYPFGEVIFNTWNIPIRFGGGFHTVGILSLFIFLVCLFFFIHSFSKYHVRIVLIVFLFVFFAPAISISAFQTTFATGIYAVSYAAEESSCSFEMIGKEILQGECQLLLKNNSNKDVTFSLTFDEDLIFSDDSPVVTLMNTNAPYEITLRGKEDKPVEIKTTVDVSKMENHIEGGYAMGVNIIITSDGNRREL